MAAQRAQTAARRAGDLALAAAFVAALAVVGAMAVPALLGFSTPAKTADVEREFRRPSPKPAPPTSLDAWLAWPAQFEAWYRDSFALRAALIRLHNVAKLELFGVSPTSEIVAGPAHWLYTTRDDAVGVFRGADPLSPRELELWKTILAERRAWCAQRHIAYVFAIAPNKETIYPERFPPRFDVVGPTRREQLVAYVARNSDFPLLDLTDAMRAAKRACAPEPVYFPLGTHWNERGAPYAYEALMARVHELVPAVAPRALAEFRYFPTDLQDDSWAGRLYMEDLLVQRNFECDFEPRHFSRAYWEDIRVRKVVDVTTDIPGSQLPRAVVFHDSMGEKLRPLLAEHFSHCAFRWVSNFDTDVIEAERPDVVIQVFVERALAAFSLSTSPMDTPQRLAGEFEASQRVLLRSGEALASLEPVSTAKASISIAREGDALRVSYGGGQLLLPELAVPDGTWPVLRIELDAPQPTQLLLEFLTHRFPSYSRLARGVQRALQPGRNVVYVKLRVPDLTGRLRLQPGLAAGDYLIRSLEVRAVPE